MPRPATQSRPGVCGQFEVDACFVMFAEPAAAVRLIVSPHYHTRRLVPSSLALSAIAGLVAGSLHVLSGPDHLAALAPLVSGARRSTIGVGVRWGFGHALGVGIIGVLSLAARELVPVGAISAVGERMVGVLLIGIGLWGILRLQKARLHVHVHAHDGIEHAHVHAHAGVASHHQPAAHRHTHAASWIGVLHGLSGGTHLVGMLPALALSRACAVAYALSFGAGTILAMAAFTLGLSLLLRRAAASRTSFHSALQYACSAASLVVGVVWLTMW